MIHVSTNFDAYIQISFLALFNFEWRGYFGNIGLGWVKLELLE